MHKIGALDLRIQWQVNMLQKPVIFLSTKCVWNTINSNSEANDICVKKHARVQVQVYLQGWWVSSGFNGSPLVTDKIRVE